MRRVGIFVFDEVEALDFAGPFEVFSVASRIAPTKKPPFHVFTIGQTGSKVTARGGLIVEPSFAFGEHPAIDVLVIRGGQVKAELGKSAVISWIAQQAARVELTASVCTGAFLIGKAGLLQGRRATTHLARC